MEAITIKIQNSMIANIHCPQIKTLWKSFPSSCMLAPLYKVQLPAYYLF